MKKPDTAILSDKEYNSALSVLHSLTKYDLWIGSQYITMHLVFNNDKEFFFQFSIFSDNFNILNDDVRIHKREFSSEETNAFLFEYNLKASELKTFIRKIKKTLGYEVRPIN